ncbi:MAG: hypothetical protein K2L51_00625 [Clostridiales bacterium]|nr:hypothetical protein [Clostridiales bacterium]
MNTLATIALAFAAVAPAQGLKEVQKPPLAEKESVVIRVLPHRTARTDGNYVVEGEDNKSAQERYNDLKAALDERFAHMFELKAALDRVQSETSKKWDEYYTLHDKYNKELKKIIALWVMEQNIEAK